MNTTNAKEAAVDENLIRGAVLTAMEELPHEEKAAYLLAAEKCPQLILSESNPHVYLKHTDGDALQAARLLAKNWELRVEIFGEERAFLRLDDLSGKGALRKQDIEVLRTGYLVLLPNDAQGRSVFLMLMDWKVK
jgi:hypothetical protein